LHASSGNIPFKNGDKRTPSFETNLYSSKELTPLERRKF
jgi:hypothetical protein